MAHEYGTPSLKIYLSDILYFHLVAYYTQDTLNQLQTIDDIPRLAMVNVPDGAYKGARNPKRTAREINSLASRPMPYQYQVMSPVIDFIDILFTFLTVAR